MEVAFAQEISSLKGGMQEKALEVVRNSMPSKVLALTAVLNSKEMNLELAAVRQPVVLTQSIPSAESHDSSESSRKKRKLDDAGHAAAEENNTKYGVKSREIIPSNTVRKAARPFFPSGICCCLPCAFILDPPQNLRESYIFWTLVCRF